MRFRPARLGCLTVLAASLLVAGCGGGAPAALPNGWQRGMNVTSYSASGFASPASGPALRALRATGTTHVALVAFWYMATRNATTIAPDLGQTPSDASLIAAAQTARALGMHVVIKPQIDVRDGTFRGQIAPASAPLWFAAYSAMLEHYASLATQAGAELLVVGDELTSMTGQTESWRALIADMRQRFHGKLTFAANWVQGAEQVRFWSDLDYIGVDAYMPLSSAEAPTVASLRSAWQPWIGRLAALHARWRRPVLFTELGYPSRRDAAAAPAQGGSGPVDQSAQANAYAAAYGAWARVPWFRGIYWWDWSTEGANAATADGSYRPAGKLAEAAIRSWDGAPAAASARRALGPPRS